MSGFETVPLVSIGMPVYNGERTIHEALDSLLAQDFKDFELIISDNASTDNTGSICKMYVERDPRVRYHLNETNLGAMANFDRLIDLSRGKYFMWAADDDSWDPEYISCMLNALHDNQDAVLSFSVYDLISIDKTPFIEKDNMDKAIGCNTAFSRLLHSCFINKWVANGCYFYGLMRRDVLLKCRDTILRVDVHHGVDIILVFHLLYYGKFIKNDRVLFHRKLDYSRFALMPPIEQRLTEKSFYLLSIAYLKWLIQWHEHYHILRIIIENKMSLKVYQKLILYLFIFISEFLYYLDSLKRTFVNYANYFLKKSKACGSK